MRLHSILLFSCALFVPWSGEAMAQVDEGQPPVKLTPEQLKMRQSEQGEAEKSDMTDEQIAENRANTGPRVRHHDLSYCRLNLGFKPGRIPPGEMGALIVTAALGRSAVMSSPPSLSVTSPKQQGIFTFGEPVFDPPPPVRHAPAFSGQLAYDDVMTFEVPFTVSFDAKHGPHRAGLVVKFELLDGESGNSLGLFSDSATTMVIVGDPLPSVVPSPASIRPAADAGSSGNADTNAGPAALEPVTGGSTGPVAGNVAPIAPRVAPEGEAADGPATVGGDDGLPIGWIAGGGVMLLLLILLLAKRR